MYTPSARPGSGLASHVATPSYQVLETGPPCPLGGHPSTEGEVGQHLHPYNSYPHSWRGTHVGGRAGSIPLGRPRVSTPLQSLPTRCYPQGQGGRIDNDMLEEQWYSYSAPQSTGDSSIPKPYVEGSTRYGVLHSSWRDLANMSLSGWNTSQEVGKLPSLPRSISFDGKGNWGAFHAKFTAFADESGWSPMQRRDQMWWCLKGQGNDHYRMLLERNPLASYQELVLCMEKQFGATDPPEMVQMEFSLAKQSEDETTLEWSRRVVSLANKAFPGVPEPLVQRQAVVRFCQGCRKQEAGLSALSSKPKTVEAALELVTWLVYSRHAVLGQGSQGIRSHREVCSASVRWDTSQPAEAGARQVDVCPRSPCQCSGGLDKVEIEQHATPEGPTPSVGQRIQSLEQKFVSLQDTVNQLSAKVAKALSSSPSTTPSAADPSCYLCDLCGEFGHSEQDCPEMDKKMALEEELSNDSGPEEEATPWPEQELASPKKD